MAKKFHELRHEMSTERQRRNKADAERMLLAMKLQETEPAAKSAKSRTT